MNGIGGSGDFTRNAYTSIFMCPSIKKDDCISTIVPMVTHVDHTLHSVDIIVTDQGVADLRFKDPIQCAHEIIEKADEQFARMDWEQEAGEKRVFADRDMFAEQKKKDRDGNTLIEKTISTKTLNKLVVKIDGSGVDNNDKIHEYSPELRTEAQEKYLQTIFKRIEQTINLGKGTISDAEQVQQTATQYSGGRQELYAIVDDIEDEIAAKYADAAEVFAYMARAYKLAGAPRSDAGELYTIKWNDDQTRKDITAAKQMAMQEVSAGVLNKWEYRRDFYGEDEATAKANVPPEPELAAPFGLV